VIRDRARDSRSRTRFAIAHAIPAIARRYTVPSRLIETSLFHGWKHDGPPVRMTATSFTGAAHPRFVPRADRLVVLCGRVMSTRDPGAEDKRQTPD